MLKTLILGIIQGLTEFLPVSSSGHLVLSQYFFNHKESTSDLSLEIFLHLGSLLAVIIFFRKDIISLFYSCFKWNKSESSINNHKTILYLLIATFITGIFGVLFKDDLEQIFQNALMVSILLFVTGIIIYFSDKIKNASLKSSELGVKKSILIGFGQAVSIMPGISRSGTTIAFSLFSGLKRDEAARFSFLLSIPAILGANILEFRSFSSLNSSMMIQYLIGFMAAFLSGYLVIGMLLNIIKNAKLKYFAYYCWGISIISITFIILGY